VAGRLRLRVVGACTAGLFFAFAGRSKVTIAALVVLVAAISCSPRRVRAETFQYTYTGQQLVPASGNFPLCPPGGRLTATLDVDLSTGAATGELNGPDGLLGPISNVQDYPLPSGHVYNLGIFDGQIWKVDLVLTDNLGLPTNMDTLSVLFSHDPNNGTVLGSDSASLGYKVYGMSSACLYSAGPGTWSGGPSPTTTLTPTPTGTPTPIATLVDPVPDLMDGSGVSQATPSLATLGYEVKGVAADGVAEVLVRIKAPTTGDQFQLTVQPPPGTIYSSNEYGALSAVNDQISWGDAVNVKAVPTDSGEMGFALYRAPADFPRAGGIDNSETARTVTIEVSEINGTATQAVPIAIVRPPVVLIHGLWGNMHDWDEFTDLTDDTRFTVRRVDYSQNIGFGILSSDPPYPQYVSARANSLGPLFNAPNILTRIGDFVQEYKGHNPRGLPVAAVQADIVAHSMGGLMTRELPFVMGFANYFNFGKGPIHKAITIGTPHLGTPLAAQLLDERNDNLRIFLSLNGNFSFRSANGVLPGAVGDLQGDGIVNGKRSKFLKLLDSATPYPIPVAVVAAEMQDSQLNNLTKSNYTKAIRYVFDCPLAEALTPSGWPAIFKQNSDAIVPLSSQLSGSTSLVLSDTVTLANANTFIAVHSKGTEQLGFGGPHELEGISSIPVKVVSLLNTPVTDNNTFRPLP
jgi:pimeloyl-ACP methyl ester carboxylesterase